MIEVRNISKSYGNLKALDEISFEVLRGELFGLIGPDGAGKTTLFRILTTLLSPDNGSALINRMDTVRNYRQIRSNIGYMPGRFSLYQDLTVEENLEFYAAVFGTTVKEHYGLIRDIYEQLVPFRNRKAGALSGGMKQKLALCCALVHKPQVLLLDEPTTGVDPVSRKDFWDMLKKLKKDHITIMVSTPFMDEASLCERIALINKGRLLSIDTPQGIRDKYGRSLFAVRTSSDMHTLLKDLKTHKRTRSAYTFGEYVHYTDRNEADDVLEDLNRHLKEKGHLDIVTFQITPGIEDTFIEFISEET